MASTALTDEIKAKFIPIIDQILYASDLSTVSVKKVRNGLQLQAGYDITPQKKAIDALIAKRFDTVLAKKEAEANPPQEDTGDDADEDVKAEDGEESSSVKAEEADEDDEGAIAYSVKAEDQENGIVALPKIKRSASSLDGDARLAAELHAQWNSGRPSRHKKKVPKTTPKKRGKKSDEIVNSDLSDSGKAKKKKKKRKVNPNSPFNAPLILSEPLSNLLGESQLSRPETVKRIWQYVKERSLQDPDDRRYILCDDSMKPIFGNKIHMFTMNKVLSQNMFKPEEKV